MNLTTQGLAILGALTGTIGSLLGVMSYRRDRAWTVLDAFAGKAAADDRGLMHVELTNLGRRPTMITEITVLRGRWRGLAWLMRRARYYRLRQLLGRVARLDSIGQALDPVIDEPLALEPNSRMKYVLTATGFRQDREAGPAPFTYICALQAPGRVLAQRVRQKVSAESWTMN